MNEIAHGAGDLVAGRYIQTPQMMLADARRFDAINCAMQELLDRLAVATAETGAVPKK